MSGKSKSKGRDELVSEYVSGLRRIQRKPKNRPSYLTDLLYDPESEYTITQHGDRSAALKPKKLQSAHTSCPPPGRKLLRWLEPGWDDYKNTYAYHKLELAIDGESGLYERFSDSTIRVNYFKSWQKKRAKWVDEQRRIDSGEEPLPPAKTEKANTKKANTEKPKKEKAKTEKEASTVVRSQSTKERKLSKPAAGAAASFSAEKGPVAPIEETPMGKAGRRHVSTGRVMIWTYGKNGESTFTELNPDAPAPGKAAPTFEKIKIKKHPPQPEQESAASAETKEDTAAPAEAEEEFELLRYLKQNNIEFIDERSKPDGCLWLIGWMELKPYLVECSAHGYYFAGTKRGCEITNYRPAWCIKRKQAGRIIGSGGRGG